MGLVDRLFEPNEPVDGACGYVRRLAAASPPAAIAETKRLVYRHVGCGFKTALREAGVAQNRFVQAPDAEEGARAFLGKRIPLFRRPGGD